MNIGQRIAARRKELGLTQEKLATQVFVTTQDVSQWENGKTTPLPANYSRIADALQLSVSELLAAELSENAAGPNWTVREKMFSETHMYTRLNTNPRRGQDDVRGLHSCRRMQKRADAESA